MAALDIALRGPGAGPLDLPLGDAPPPVDGAAEAELPTLTAAGVGQLVFVGVAAVALPALGAAGEGSQTFAGTADVELPTVASEGDGALGFSGTGAAALPAPAADGDGLQVFLGAAAVALGVLESDAAGALGFAGTGAAALPGIAAAGAGTITLVFAGTAAVSLPAMVAAATGALRFVGTGSAALPALTADATGSLVTSGEDDEPAFLTLPRAGALYELALPAVASTHTITLTRPMARLHIGDTAVIPGITVRTRAGEFVDPSSLTVSVRTPLGDSFDLVYGVAPTSGDGDAVIRTGEGTFDVQVEITEERGAGVYEYTVVTTGARAAEPGSFKVHERAV
jgi:hypothetical protein